MIRPGDRAAALLLLVPALAGPTACKGKPARPAAPPPIAIGPVGEPFGPVAGVRPGMTAAEVAKVAPELKASKERAAVTSSDGTFEVRFDEGGRVDSIQVALPRHPIAELDKAWGPGERQRESSPGDRFYMSRDQTLMVRVHPGAAAGYTLDFERVAALAAVLGEGREVGLFGVPVLGRAEPEVEAALAPHLAVKASAGGEVQTPPIRTEVGTVTAHWTAAPQIRTVSFGGDFSVDTDANSIRHLFDRKWGAPMLGSTTSEAMYSVDGMTVSLRIDERGFQAIGQIGALPAAGSE